MIITKVTSLTNDTHDAYHAALGADNAWQAALDAAKIERYSKGSHGDKGSELRRLYEAKLTADAKYHELIDLVRRYQDPRQVGLPKKIGEEV